MLRLLMCCCQNTRRRRLWQRMSNTSKRRRSARVVDHYSESYSKTETTGTRYLLILVIMLMSCLRKKKGGFDRPHKAEAALAMRDVVQLPNGVLGVKRVLGYGKRFIVDYVTWTCPEPKSAGCPPGTLEEFFYSQNKMAPLRDSFIVKKKTTLVLIMVGYLGKIATICAKQHQLYIISLL